MLHQGLGIAKRDRAADETARSPAKIAPPASAVSKANVDVRCTGGVSAPIGSLVAHETFIRREIHGIPGIASIETSFAHGIVKQTYVHP